MSRLRLSLAVDVSEMRQIADLIADAMPDIALGIRAQIKELQHSEVDVFSNCRAASAEERVGLTTEPVELQRGYREDPSGSPPSRR